MRRLSWEAVVATRGPHELLGRRFLSFHPDPRFAIRARTAFGQGTCVTIKKVHIKNFKSIVDPSLDLGPVNVFIGENGSGKSNILEAFAFMAAAAPSPGGKLTSVIRRLLACADQIRCVVLLMYEYQHRIADDAVFAK